MCGVPSTSPDSRYHGSATVACYAESAALVASSYRGLEWSLNSIRRGGWGSGNFVII